MPHATPTLAHLVAAQREDLLDEAAVRLSDADHVFAEIMDRGQREDLYALRAEYVAESRFLYAFVADCAIHLVERKIEARGDEDDDGADAE